jgi:hypothetical protein
MSDVAHIQCGVKPRQVFLTTPTKIENPKIEEKTEIRVKAKSISVITFEPKRLHSKFLYEKIANISHRGCRD